MGEIEKPDPNLTNKIVTHLKSQGIFDQFRRECMADVDTKPAYQNLRQRVEGSVAAFLNAHPWRPDMNKNQLRDNLRKHIQSGGFLDTGVDRIVDQVVNPKIYSVFMPKVEQVVQSCVKMDESARPTFAPPAPDPVEPAPARAAPAHNRHNLAPCASVPAQLSASNLEPLQSFGLDGLDPIEDADAMDVSAEEKKSEQGSPAREELTPAEDKNYVGDDEVPVETVEEEEDEEEESPPFERNSENDRMILGVHSDSDTPSDETQVVTTIVDDSLEERIDNDEADDKKKEEEKVAVAESSAVESDVKVESVKPFEASSGDESVPKTPTINAEESDGTLIEFNSISEYKRYQKRLRGDGGDGGESDEELKVTSTDEEVSVVETSRTAKPVGFDEESNSSHGEAESKVDKLKCFRGPRPKAEEMECESSSETNAETNAEREFERLSIRERQHSDTESDTKAEAERSSREKSHHKTGARDKLTRPDSASSGSPRDKREKRDDRREKKSDSASRHDERARSRDKSESERARDKSDGDKKGEKGKEPHRRGKSRERYDRRKQDDKKSDRKDSSRHSSSRHGHRSSSDKHRSDHHKDSDKHRSTDKEKDKDRKKHRDRCKMSGKEDSRRSTDRDSNGPSGRGYSSSTSRSCSSRAHKETTLETGDRTSSSDNGVSDSVGTVDSTTHVVVNEIASPDPENFESGCSDCEFDSPLYETAAQKSKGQDLSSRHSSDSGHESDSKTNADQEADSKVAIVKTKVDSKVKACDRDCLDQNSVEIAQKEGKDGKAVDGEVAKENNKPSQVSDSEKIAPSNSSQKEASGEKSSPSCTPKDETKSSDSSNFKFKKPKIAANIREVKKIMRERQKLKQASEAKKNSTDNNSQPDKNIPSHPNGKIAIVGKENSCELENERQLNEKLDGCLDNKAYSSLGNKKIKKPKIATNIFEVKKIMQARQKMKEMANKGEIETHNREIAKLKSPKKKPIDFDSKNQPEPVTNTAALEKSKKVVENHASEVPKKELLFPRVYITRIEDEHFFRANKISRKTEEASKIQTVEEANKNVTIPCTTVSSLEKDNIEQNVKKTIPQKSDETLKSETLMEIKKDVKITCSPVSSLEKDGIKQIYKKVIPNKSEKTLKSKTLKATKKDATITCTPVSSLEKESIVQIAKKTSAQKSENTSKVTKKKTLLPHNHVKSSEKGNSELVAKNKTPKQSEGTVRNQASTKKTEECLIPSIRIAPIEKENLERLAKITKKPKEAEDSVRNQSSMVNKEEFLIPSILVGTLEKENLEQFAKIATEKSKETKSNLPSTQAKKKIVISRVKTLKDDTVQKKSPEKSQDSLARQNYDETKQEQSSPCVYESHSEKENQEGRESKNTEEKSMPLENHTSKGAKTIITEEHIHAKPIDKEKSLETVQKSISEKSNVPIKSPAGMAKKAIIISRVSPKPSVKTSTKKITKNVTAEKSKLVMKSQSPDDTKEEVIITLEKINDGREAKKIKSGKSQENLIIPADKDCSEISIPVYDLTSENENLGKCSTSSTSKISPAYDLPPENENLDHARNVSLMPSAVDLLSKIERLQHCSTTPSRLKRKNSDENESPATAKVALKKRKTANNISEMKKIIQARRASKKCIKENPDSNDLNAEKTEVPKKFEEENSNHLQEEKTENNSKSLVDKLEPSKMSGEKTEVIKTVEAVEPLIFIDLSDGADDFPGFESPPKLNVEALDDFRGFETASNPKLECLERCIRKLSDEIKTLPDSSEKITNLVTSWFNLSPDLDDRLESTLGCKVHRKYKLRVPPVSTEHYRFDPKVKAYVLTSDLNQLDGNSSKAVGPCDDAAIAVKRKSASLKHKVSDSFSPAEEPITLASLHRQIGSPLLGPCTFSVTFDQTYDEVLNRSGDPEPSTGSPDPDETEESGRKTGGRLPKTKGPEMKVDGPKKESRKRPLTPADTEVEKPGKTLKRSFPSVISNAERSKFVATPQQRLNEVGALAKTKTPGGQKIHADWCNTEAPLTENRTEQKTQRDSRLSGSGKRYDSSELYKPRLQLSSRRRNNIAADSNCSPSTGP